MPGNLEKEEEDLNKRVLLEVGILGGDFLDRGRVFISTISFWSHL